MTVAQELLGVRFFCRCGKGYIWHRRAIYRWLRARGLSYEVGSVRFSDVWELVDGGVTLTATWVSA